MIHMDDVRMPSTGFDEPLAAAINPYPQKEDAVSDVCDHR